jgi:hypothetical protein
VASRRLDRDLPIVTTKAAARRLRLRGFRRARGLLRWQAHELTKVGRAVRITSLPGRHAPGAAQALLPPVMGSMLEFGPIDDYAAFKSPLSDFEHEVRRRGLLDNVRIVERGSTVPL